MKKLSMLSLGIIAVSSAAFAGDTPSQARVTPLLTKALPGIQGKEGTMITVELPPGADSPPHRHNASTFVYVLEGAVVMQVQGGQPVTVQQGETFYEGPADVHLVSRNVSMERPAKLLVLLVKDVGAPITVPAK